MHTVTIRVRHASHIHHAAAERAAKTHGWQLRLQKLVLEEDSPCPFVITTFVFTGATVEPTLVASSLR